MTTTIICPRCGCEMTAISEACPMCGYSKELDNPIKGLREIFAECVEKQRMQPHFDWYITIEDNGYFRETENWFFFKEERFTNIPMLGVGFVFNSDQEKLFLSLPFASELVKEEDSDGTYYIDCGDDVDKATRFTTAIIRKVYGCDEDIPFVLKSLGSTDPKSYLNNHPFINFRFDNLPFDEAIYAKLRKKVVYYNEKAEKYANFDSGINFNENKRWITGAFSAQDENSGKNYLAKLKIAGRNESLKAEIIYILNFCYKLFELHQ